MARYGLILRQDGTLLLRIISKPLLTSEWAIQIEHRPQHLKTGWGRGGIILQTELAA